MRVAVVTTAADMFGGVFATSYQRAGGHAPVLVVVLPSRADLGFRGVWRLIAAWKLVGPWNAARLVCARRFRRPLTTADRASGLAADWISALAGPQAVVAHRDSINDPGTIALIASYAPDALVSIGAPVIFKSDTLRVAPLNLNVHNGRLPRYRGHFATFWEILAREPVAFTTIHEMTPAVDEGRVVAERGIPVAQVRSFMDLLVWKKQAGGELLAQALAAYQAGLPGGGPRTAPSAQARGYFGWPTPSDLMRFSWTAARRAAKAMSAVSGITADLK